MRCHPLLLVLAVCGTAALATAAPAAGAATAPPPAAPAVAPSVPPPGDPALAVDCSPPKDMPTDPVKRRQWEVQQIKAGVASAGFVASLAREFAGEGEKYVQEALDAQKKGANDRAAKLQVAADWYQKLSAQLKVIAAKRDAFESRLGNDPKGETPATRALAQDLVNLGAAFSDLYFKERPRL